MHLQNGILLNNKKEQNIDIYNNMGESPMYFAFVNTMRLKRLQTA